MTTQSQPSLPADGKKSSLIPPEGVSIEEGYVAEEGCQMTVWQIFIGVQLGVLLWLFITTFMGECLAIGLAAVVNPSAMASGNLARRLWNARPRR